MFHGRESTCDGMEGAMEMDDFDPHLGTHRKSEAHQRRGKPLDVRPVKPRASSSISGGFFTGQGPNSQELGGLRDNSTKQSMGSILASYMPAR